MPGPTTEVLNEDVKTLRSDIQRIEVGLAEIRTEFRDAHKLAAGLIKALLVSVLGGIATAIWMGATLSADVRNLGQRVGQVETRLDRVETKLGQVEVDVAKLNRTVSAPPK